ncbi:unnamed protein product [Paramecium primaurelia]|uniref:Uncharacterized protein n=1 Tax=Paramecium primaurelia TaxID=5886 RepID=A0A8S1MYW9_PARPR|nr:unnamed protein product [Paramecium primaurelia]
MDALTKIVATGERAISELNKQSLTQWNATTTSTIKYIIERLSLCFDEINFHLQKKGLNEEANVISKLYNHFNVLFQKVEEINQRKHQNPPELPLEYCQRSFSTNASTKTIFGGAEIQSFSIFSAQKSKFVSAEQEFRSNKPKFKKNVLSKGTDTGEDAMRYLNIEYLGEKERELQRAKEENEMNLREIEKFLKLKGLWSEIHASNAPYKLQDLGKTLERELQRNEMFINEQIRIANQEPDFPSRDMKQEIKDRVVVGVQKSTADRILKYAERKMKEEFEKFQLKKNGGLQMHKRKSQNMQRIDELEHLINTKNEEILEKESKMSALYSKFEDQERKLINLMIQMEQIKANEKNNNTFTSSQANEKQSHIEIQVSLSDPKIFKLELQLKEIVEENQNMKGELQTLYEQAKNDKQKVLLKPQLIEEVLMMIIQSELQAEGKIELLQTFLQYLIENSENDIAKMPPNELYKTVRQKMQYNNNSNRNLEEVLEKFEEMQSDDEDFSPSSIKKTKKNKNKQQKSKKIILERADSQIDQQSFSPEKSEKFIGIKKSKNKFEDQSNENSESQIILNNNNNTNNNINNNNDSNYSISMFKKKPLNKISEENSIIQKNSPRKQDVNSPSSGNRNILNNTSTFKQNQSDSKFNKNIINSSFNQNSLQSQQQQNNQQQQQQQIQLQQPKESSRFRTEQQKQLSSGRQQANKSRGQIDSSNQKSVIQSNQTPQFINKTLRQIKQRHSIKDEHGEVDYDEIDDEVANRGVQVNFGSLYLKASIINSQEDNSNMMGSQIGLQTPQMRQSYRQLEEKVTAKFTQTDDFFMWNLFQKMQVDLGLTEEQIKKLEQIFLNEQQFIHYYEKTPSQRQKSRASTVLADQTTKVKQEKFIDNTINDSKMTTMVQQKNETTDSEQQIRRPTISIMKTTQPPKGLESPMNLVGRQKSQVLLSYTNESSIIQPNQGRSISQTSDVHIVNYGSVSTDTIAKKQRQTTSQKILEDMLKNKTGLTSPFDIETKEQKEQKMYFHVFGDEMQTDADFELEAVRANLGKPLEVIQDHLKEDAMKKIYQQFVNRPKNPWQDQLYMIISQFANKPPQSINYIDFKKYYENYMRVHKRCGDGCIHIQRFLARIGFGINSKRKALNMSKQSVSPFELPKLK